MADNVTCFRYEKLSNICGLFKTQRVLYPYSTYLLIAKPVGDLTRSNADLLADITSFPCWY
jgi:hypothetical protein